MVVALSLLVHRCPHPFTGLRKIHTTIQHPREFQSLSESPSRSSIAVQVIEDNSAINLSLDASYMVWLEEV